MNIEFIKLHKFIEDNEELISYINKLLNTAIYKNQEDNKERLERLQELGNSYLEETESLNNIIDKMSSLGLVLDEDNELVHLEGYIPEYVEDSKDALCEYGHFYYRHNDKYCCYHDHEWENEDRVSYSTSINGFKITKDIIENENKNHLSKNAYDIWLKDNSNIGNELKELENTITQDLELLDKKIFGKKQLRDKILANKEKLIRLKNEKKRGDYLKKKSDFFESIDEEKKQLLIEYLNSIDKCNSISVDVKEEYFGLKTSNEKEMISNVDSLIEMAIKYGFISEDEVEKYNYILMNIDLSNVIVTDSYVDSIKSGRYFWKNESVRRLINNYCSKIVDMKLTAEFNSLSKEAEEKAKEKKLKK